MNASETSQKTSSTIPTITIPVIHWAMIISVSTSIVGTIPTSSFWRRTVAASSSTVVLIIIIVSPSATTSRRTPVSVAIPPSTRTARAAARTSAIGTPRTAISIITTIPVSTIVSSTSVITPTVTTVTPSAATATTTIRRRAIIESSSSAIIITSHRPWCSIIARTTAAIVVHAWTRHVFDSQNRLVNFPAIGLFFCFRRLCNCSELNKCIILFHVNANQFTKGLKQCLEIIPFCG
mmetsp:Transcript_13896/g.30360  ORF Transcript_13896/g.30360 Transcript_13896/m.30360 type:complete len:236 (+) Transcript_13896:67-774(+)